LDSRKMRALTHAEKWAYVSVHLTRLSSFTGVFNYPLVMWARDADLTGDELDDSIERLVEVGLIEWDTEDEVVRIVGFHRQRPPENASRSIGLAGDFSDLLRRQVTSRAIVLRAAVEFAVAAVERSRGWKPEGSELLKLRDTLGPFLRGIYQEHEVELLAALGEELKSTSKAALKEIGSLLPALSMASSDTVSAPCPHPVDTRDVDETRRDEDPYKDLDENEDAQTSTLEAGAAQHPAENVKGLRKVRFPTESTRLNLLAQQARGGRWT